MPMLLYKNFIGRIPILHKTKLPINAGQTCDNAVVESGALVPMKTLGTGASLETGELRRTAYYIPTSEWKSWVDVVDVVPAPVVNDNYRFFFAGPSEGYAKISSTDHEPTSQRRLGVLQPNYANDGDPLSFLDRGTADGTVKYTVSYAYTCVDEFGGESVLSTATAPYDLDGDQCIELWGFTKNSLATYGNDIEHFRLYRRVTTTSGAGDWFWVKAGVNGETYWDLPVVTVDDDTLVYDSNTGTNLGTDLGTIGDNCESQDYDAPPEDIIGMTEIANGVLLAWTENQVCPNVPFIYHAFPSGYRIDFAETIMGIGIFQETALVATNGQPYLIGGVSPANYIKKKIPYPWPCLSRRSVVSSNKGVFYASERGMVWWNGTSIRLITENVIGETEWAALIPANMLAFFYKEQIYVFSDESTSGFILDVSTENPFIIDFELPYNVYGGFVDAGTDALRLITLSAGAYRVANFSDGANLTLEWQSREEVTPAMNFSAIKVLGTGWGTAIIKVYGDGALKDTITATKNGITRLKPGYRAERWSVVVTTSTVDIETIAMATSIGELRNV